MRFLRTGLILTAIVAMSVPFPTSAQEATATAPLAACAAIDAPAQNDGPVNVTPPAADLPANLAAFSGNWVGAWSGSGRATVITVESIGTTNARLAITLAAYDDGVNKDQARSLRMMATVQPDGSLLYGGPQKTSLTLQPDGTLLGQSWKTEAPDKITGNNKLSKCSMEPPQVTASSG